MTHAPTVQVASCPRFSWLLLTRLVKRPLLLLTLSAGLLLGAFPFVSAVETVSAAETQVASGLADGTHVFGESPEAGQVGATYMVLNVQSQRVVGAFYKPSSSFDCFSGHITGNEMALTITDSYDDTRYPYTVALDTNSQTASQGGTVNEVVPSGFYPLTELSELDGQILATCQTNQAL